MPCDNLEGWGGGGRSSGGKGCRFACGRFLLIQRKHHHHIEKQLSSN